ncbi:MAG: preprotein translocase subunit YajC [Bdellovibrionales bacterium]
MLISQAFAQETAAAPAAMGGGDMLAQFLPLILIFFIFYFLLIRPQQKRIKEHQAMLGALQKGDRVVTGGGIIGTVVKADDGDEVTVDIAENVKVRVQKSTISAVLK